MSSRSTWAIVALMMGIMLVLCGLALVVGYISWAVIARLGEGDQSLLFWYLPLVLIGIMAVVLGAVAADWGLRSQRKAD